MSRKTPFVTREAAEAIAQRHPTPFYLYDEAGIRKTARVLTLLYHITAPVKRGIMPKRHSAATSG